MNKVNTVKHMRDTMLKDWSLWAPSMVTNTSAIVGVSAAFLPLLDATNRRRGWEDGKVSGHGHARHRNRDGFGEEGVEGMDEDDENLAQIVAVGRVEGFMREATVGLAYSARMAAAVHLGKMLTTMLAECGVRSNVVARGFFSMDARNGGQTDSPTESAWACIR
ncbi:hypothetical protein K432DRAFT_427727 [Lepidopterella palustris CBS 459.81]|uniref:Uncharacterized protein n=1 Tax=Lepidopterella palustris CBS 459.81 TaxID=1314670 RepID=A0A8E2E5J3_9PEZI|nr:hypothetical protein K432DRAFT_427727 [Lepidopterella palustris CBS 459.81]